MHLSNKCLFLLIFLALSSCRYDKVYYWNNPQKTNKKLKYPGYYYMMTNVDNSSLEENNLLDGFVFYPNGSFYRYPSIEGHLEIEKYHDSENIKYGLWGFYSIEKDTIGIEFLVRDMFSARRAFRYEIEGRIIENGQKIILHYKNGFNNTHKEYFENINDTLEFKETFLIPNESNNWIKNHRIYKKRREKELRKKEN